MKTITQATAEKVLAAVKTAYKSYMGDDEQYGPQLVMDWDWLGTGPAPSIVWEEGPYEWAYRFPEGGVDEEMSALAEEFGVKAPQTTPKAELPNGVWTEAVTSWAIAIYPSD